MESLKTTFWLILILPVIVVALLALNLAEVMHSRRVGAEDDTAEDWPEYLEEKETTNAHVN